MKQTTCGIDAADNHLKSIHYGEQSRRTHASTALQRIAKVVSAPRSLRRKPPRQIGHVQRGETIVAQPTQIAVKKGPQIGDAIFQHG